MDGTLDTSFSGDGKLTTNFTSGADGASAAAVQGDGKIVASGWAGGKGGQFALTRYGIAAADKRITQEPLEGWIAIGELALDGSVRPVRGALAAALACRSSGRKGLICPAANTAEAALVEDIEVVAVTNLHQCIDFFKGKWSPPSVMPTRGLPRGP